MESIHPDNINPQYSAKSLPRGTVSGQKIEPTSSAHTNTLKASLTDITQLSRSAQNSSPDLRPEAIERANALLENPNWLNDESLDLLADKLIDSDHF